MGGGSWTSASYVTHSTTTRGFSSMDAFNSASTQDLYRSRKLEDCLNPYNVIRECCDSDEHPNTVPVILALDVTGSMGSAASAVAKQLGGIMSKLYESVTDVEFMTMAIGDLSYDSAPIQASQFESDIRIAEQLEKVYFEAGGGGNQYESYTAAWFFGLYNTKLDCWNRGRKGIIITLGDEPLNPYLPKNALSNTLGCSLQSDVETEKLYEDVIQKFDVFHIAVDDSATGYRYYMSDIKSSFGKLLGDRLKVSTLQDLGPTISSIIDECVNGNTSYNSDAKSDSDNDLISW